MAIKITVILLLIKLQNAFLLQLFSQVFYQQVPEVDFLPLERRIVTLRWMMVVSAKGTDSLLSTSAAGEF